MSNTLSFEDLQTTLFANDLYKVFGESIAQYHQKDDINATIQSPYVPKSLSGLLYQKNWIDTVQWHLEDIIRRTDISNELFIETKRRIDQSNQERTDMVEQIDDWFMAYFDAQNITQEPNAKINSESIAWLIDRMSILTLKIYHMKEQTERTDADQAHIQKCQTKLDILLVQKQDLATAFDELIHDVKAGIRYVKVYRQIKMYNDQSLNPQLYQNK